MKYRVIASIGNGDYRTTSLTEAYRQVQIWSVTASIWKWIGRKWSLLKTVDPHEPCEHCGVPMSKQVPYDSCQCYQSHHG